MNLRRSANSNRSFSRREFRNREAVCKAWKAEQGDKASVGANSGIVRRVWSAISLLGCIIASVGANSGIVRRPTVPVTVPVMFRASVGANSGIVRRLMILSAAFQPALLQSARIQES